MLKPCLVVPVYNHARALAVLLDELKPCGLPCILVDDGSDDGRRLDDLARRQADWVRLLRHPKNLGKGAAVMTGAREAQARGFTHLLQIDADGQHRAQDVPLFLEAGAAAPEAVIYGIPIFDGSVPRSRRWGRWLTTVWIWINTLSLDIRDGLCGFRLYPVAPLLQLERTAPLGRRMDFDPEVLVRFKWLGLRVAGLPTRVRYPFDGLSHFKLVRDNWLISCMHARLFFGMLARLPALALKPCVGIRSKN